MSNLSVFNFHHSNVRIQLLNNEPLFCLTDVIKILNIKNAHASRFNFSEKGIHKMYTPTKGGNQELLFVNEPNLYRVIFRSNKKEAIDFQNWVFDEVLPTIRKTGSYSLTINAEQQQAIQQAVNERVYRTDERHQAVYSKFHQQFKIPRYQDLPASKFNEAIEWLGGVTKTRKDMIEVNRTNLICLVHHMLWLNDFYIDNRLYDVFKMLGSNFGIRLHDHFGDGAFVASMFKQQLEKKQLQKL
ncbi:Bro-N domain-containing protein [Gilliamella sp. BG2]|uniref:BRO-N domain-containing protein n=1 Tax=Gilliamella sp. BG2 TaxID=3351509 RepID=UPI003985ECB4